MPELPKLPKVSQNFETLIESTEFDVTSIPVVRHESFPTGNSGYIPVSVQDLAYADKAEGVGTSPKTLNRHNDLLSSSEEVHGPRRYSRHSEGLDTHVFQRTSTKDKSLVEKPKHVVRGPE
ncbi:hypothetical protein O181_032795 [Austropuccinia psidii MF-1]|uniref:Uncharacterized protein n=1 Tax=Austropuccinia psidii MF-1 TaxID=1389203 RepID=A0A9Q3D088_9BASI|nr:hypothetical protein [Austropuccinia psidii MF-1]